MIEFCITIFVLVIIFSNNDGTPVNLPRKQTVSRLAVNLANKVRNPEYIQNYFAPMKRVLQPPDARTLKYTVDIPLKRPEILPKEILQLASPVSFDKISGSKSFEIEKDLLKDMPNDLLLANTDVIKYSMEHIFNQSRNTNVDSYVRDVVASYIYEKFARYGLVAAIHSFSHARPKYEKQGEVIHVDGSNILGFFPGKFWNTAKDRPLIIGAHWDTVKTTKGFNDNGSGVTVMLEISRILIGSKCFVPDFTIIFVAFDAEEEGAIGTQQLINSIIVPYYKRQGVDIQGAIILDTVFNYDPNANSQDIPSRWKTAIPDKVKKIKYNNQKGDFLALISRNNPEEIRMTKKIQK